MSVIETERLRFSYGKHEVLKDLTLAVPEGAVYALLGRNGSGKTTLMQLLLGLRRAQQGRAAILGNDCQRLTTEDRMHIAYVAEGQQLPRWMRVEQLEAYVAPLYPTWDAQLASQLRIRFALDPHRKIGNLSRGEYMKAALLIALAARPKVLIMDEPFTGMDVIVKDELVRGLLDTAASEGWTILMTSHDIGELEMLADWVGVLANGKMSFSEPMEQLRDRFRRVEVTVPTGFALPELRIPASWMDVERSSHRLSFVMSDAKEDLESLALRERFPSPAQVSVAPVPLRDIFAAISRRQERIPGSRDANREVSA